MVKIYGCQKEREKPGLGFFSNFNDSAFTVVNPLNPKIKI